MRDQYYEDVAYFLHGSDGEEDVKYEKKHEKQLKTNKTASLLTVLSSILGVCLVSYYGIRQYNLSPFVHSPNDNAFLHQHNIKSAVHKFSRNKRPKHQVKMFQTVNCSAAFLNPFQFHTFNPIMGIPIGISSPGLCIPECHLNKVFTVHQELQRGPRILREVLLDIEWHNTANLVFLLKKRTKSQKYLSLHRLKVTEKVKPESQFEEAEKLDSFGDLIDRIAIGKTFVSKSNISVYCFKAVDLLKTTVPLGISKAQKKLLNKKKHFKSDNQRNIHQKKGRKPNHEIDIKMHHLDAKIESFPRNTIVIADLFHPILGSWSTICSFILLPDVPMPRRIASNHIGYFETVVNQLDGFPKPMKFINRINLHSVKKVYFYIDTSVPSHLYTVIKDAVHSWNPPLQDALKSSIPVIKCVSPIDNDFPVNYHVGNIQFNSILYLPHTAGFSISHSIVDPRSGEVLASKIFIDNGHSVEFYREWAFSTFHNKTIIHENKPKFDDDAMEEEENDFEEYMSKASSLKKNVHHPHILAAKVFSYDQKSKDDSKHRNKLERKSFFAHLHLNAEVKAVLDSCLGQVITHEVGHALGLRHNFVGSTQNTWSQNGQLQYTKIHGVSSSLMDYLPLNIRSDDKRTTICQNRVGDYDSWAIRYGYSQYNDDAEEEQSLKKIIQQFTIHDFQSDEDLASKKFPLAKSFDLSHNPLNYYHDQLKIIKLVHANIHKVESRLTKIFPDRSLHMYYIQKVVLGKIHRIGLAAAIFIGGKVLKYGKFGGRFARYTTSIPKAQQISALEIMLNIILDSNSNLYNYKLEHKDRNYLIKNSGKCKGLEQNCLGSIPISLIEAIPRVITTPLLKELFHHDRMNGLVINTSSNTLNLSEMLTCCFASIWKGMDWTNCPMNQTNINLIKKLAMINSVTTATQTIFVKTLLMLYKDKKISGNVKDELVRRFLIFERFLNQNLKKIDKTSVQYAHFFRIRNNVRNAMKK